MLKCSVRACSWKPGPEKCAVQCTECVCVCVWSYTVQNINSWVKRGIHIQVKTQDPSAVRHLSLTQKQTHPRLHKIRQTQRLITCSAATNWIVLTSARDCPGGKLNLTVSRKCALSIWMSTNTYSILIPAVESMGTAGRDENKKKDGWIIHSVMSGKPMVYTLLMVPRTLTRCTCSVIQLYGNRYVHIYSSQWAPVCYNWNTFSVNLRQELMQRPQLFREGEGHMRLLLMPLISQAIYYAAGPGRGS